MLSFFPRDALDEIWDLIEPFLRVFLPTLAMRENASDLRIHLSMETLMILVYSGNRESEYNSRQH